MIIPWKQKAKMREDFQNTIAGFDIEKHIRIQLNPIIETSQYSNRNIAEILGTNETSIRRLRNSAQKIPIDILYKVCLLLEIDIAELFPRESNMTKGERS